MSLTQELQQKVSDYENLLGEILEKNPAKIFKVSSGPFLKDKKSWYRVNDGSNSQLASFDDDLFFKTKNNKIQSGKEVIVMGNKIVGIIPDELEVKKEQNSFKLIGWEEIGGLKSQLSRIRETIELPLLHSDYSKEFGLEPIKGLLLYGHPGCGKTLIAKAIASTILKDNNASEDSFVYIKGAELLSMYVGATEERIIRMFKNCRNFTHKTKKRSVIFIDEAEAILPARGSRVSSDVDKTIVPTFLSEMDGFDDNSPFIILSSNLPNSIDEAVLRPGRIDVKVEISKPTQDDAVEIFDIHLKKVKKFEDINILSQFGAEFIFESQKNVTGAMIESCVKLATQNALGRYVKNKKDKAGVTCLDLKHSIESLKN